MATRNLIFGTSRRIRQTATQLIRRAHGNVTITFALSSVVMIGIVGVAIDYGRWQMQETKLQNVVDSATLAAVHQLKKADWTQTKVESAVARFMESNGAGLNGIVVESVKIDQTKLTIEVNVRFPVEKTLSAILSNKPTSIRTRSTARADKPVNAPTCILALEPVDNEGLSLTGGSSIDGVNCRVQVNSPAIRAANVGGGGYLKSSENCIVGTTNISGGSTVSPTPTPGCKSMPDPFAGRAPLAYGGCTYTAGLVRGKTVTVNPGVYCGGLKFDAGANVTFSPGIYVIKDGTLLTSGGGIYTGNGVSFYLTGTGAGISLTGGGVFDIKAPKSGALQSFLFYLDRNASPAKRSVISGGGNVKYEGIFYFPTQPIEMTGGTDTLDPSPWTMFIAKTMLISGGGTMKLRFDTKSATVPLPPEFPSSKGVSLIN